MNPLVPFHIDSMSVRESNIRVADKPAEAMKLDLKIDVKADELRENDESDTYGMMIGMTVYADVCNAEDRDDKRMSAMANVAVRISMSKNIFDRDDAFVYLKRNGVSMAYSHARSYLMTLAALSPMGSFILPPVMPDVLLASQGEDESMEEK